MLGRALKMAFWVIYDHLGKLILANLLISLALMLVGAFAFAGLVYGDPLVRLTLGLPATVLCLGVVLPVGLAALAHMAKVLIDTRDGSLSDFFTGIRLYWRRAIAIGLIYLFVTTAFATSVWFYAAKLEDSVPWLGYAMSAVALWGLVFLVLTASLVMPSLVQKKVGVLETIKLASMLVLDNPVLTLGVTIQLIAITALMIPVPPLLFVFYFAVVAVLGTTTYEMLARKYAVVADLAGQSPDGKPRVTRAALAAELAKQDEHDDFLNRGFRDFLFPWKG